MEGADKIQEILERLVRMETKLDDLNSIREKSEQAFSTSKQNEKDIGEIQTDLKHIWYAAGTMAITIIAFFIKITLYK